MLQIHDLSKHPKRFLLKIRLGFSSRCNEVITCASCSCDKCSTDSTCFEISWCFDIIPIFFGKWISTSKTKSHSIKKNISVLHYLHTLSFCHPFFLLLLNVYFCRWPFVMVNLEEKKKENRWNRGSVFDESSLRKSPMKYFDPENITWISPYRQTSGLFERINF